MLFVSETTPCEVKMPYLGTLLRGGRFVGNMAASTKSSFAARETDYQPLSGLIPTVYPESFVILTNACIQH